MNLMVMTNLTYAISIGLTRLPNTNMGDKKCNSSLDIVSVANCGQKIPSGHTMMAVVSYLFLVDLFPEYKALFMLLLILNLFSILLGHLHRSLDIFLGIIIAWLLFKEQQKLKNKLYSLNFVTIFGIILVAEMILLIVKIKVKDKK